MKKIIFTILVLVVFSSNIFAQNNEHKVDETEIVNFLIKYCSFTDGNPTRKAEADSINFFLKRIFEKQYTADNVPDLINKSLLLLYDNSISVFEDGYDVLRMGMRRYMCFVALAWLSDDWRYYTFIEDAGDCLRRTTWAGDEEETLQARLIINMVRFYKYLSEDSDLLRLRAIEFQNDLRNTQKHIHNENFIKEYNKILLKFIE